MKKSLLIAATLLSAAATVQADELFLSIHSAASMAQGAGLVLASQAIEQKVPVRVLLCDAAGDIAVTGKEMPFLRGSSSAADEASVPVTTRRFP